MLLFSLSFFFSVCDIGNVVAYDDDIDDEGDGYIVVVDVIVVHVVFAYVAVFAKAVADALLHICKFIEDLNKTGNAPLRLYHL